MTCQALKTNDPTKLVAGIEFFPEMGKYYGSGHRSCKVYVTIEQLLQSDLCPVCHKPVTVGVAYRVDQLADRTVEQAERFIRHRYRIAPLQVIIADNLGFQTSSKKVQKIYQQMLEMLGNEFHILLNASLEDIAKHSNVSIAQSIYAIRVGNVSLTPGYDGVYGSINF